jgi:hypothetical protein
MSLLVQKEGYYVHTQLIPTTISMWFWGNILSGGFTGSSTDYATGAMWNYAPDNYYINLQPIEQKKDSHFNFEKDSEVKKFAMLNFTRIKNESSKDHGEYLETLVAMIKAEKKDIKQILTSNPDAVSFGEAVSKFYFTRTAEDT